MATAITYNELQALYLGLLDRPANATGETYWYNQSQSGVNVLNAISPYAQYYSDDKGGAGVAGAALSSSNIAGEIQNIYTNLLGYTPAASSSGVAYWAGVYNAGNSIGSIVDSIFNIVENLPSTSPYINEKTTMDSRLAAATSFTQANAFNTYNQATYLAEGQSIIKGSSTNTSTYILTPKADVATATNFIGSLTPYNIDGVGPTLNYDDILTGTSSATPNNTLTINNDYAQGVSLLPLGLSLSNIQNITLNTNGNAGTAGTFFNSTPFAGVTDLTVTSAGSGTDYVQAASTTNINVAHDSSALNFSPNDSVFVLGGDGVTVTDNSASGLVIGLSTVGTVPTSSMVPAGAIKVTVNGTGGNGSINIVGGSSVTVDLTNNANTQNIYVGNTGGINGNTGDSPNGGLANTAGAIIITDNGTGGITSFGGSTVQVTAAGGGVQVGELNPVVASNNPSSSVTVNDTQAKTYNGFQASPGGAVSIHGGTDVTVITNTGGGVTVGDNKATSDPSGTVTVTNTSTNANGPFGIGVYAGGQVTTIYGGTNIQVNEAGGTVTVGGATAINPSGTVQVTETAVSHQAVNIDGGNGVTVNAQGQDVNIGLNTGTSGAQQVTQSAVLTGKGMGIVNGGVNIDGGTSVTVNTTGGGVNIGSPNVAVPTGAVNIVDTFSGTNTASTEAFNVLGGSTINITTTPTSGAILIGSPVALNVAGTALTNASSDPTGNVVITDSETNNGTVTYGTANTNVYTDGATSVSITGGDAGGNIIADVNQYLATGGANAGTPVGTSHLASVTLDGFAGNEVIQSDVFTTLAIDDSLKGATATTVTNGGTAGYDTEGAHTLALTLNNDTNAGTAVTDATATAITVATGASSKDDIKITAAKATSLTFTNTAALTLAAADTISATGADTIKATGSGALNLGDTTGWTGAGELVSINASGASGAVTATINGLVTAFTGGSGNDVITVSDGASQSINGGGGTNEVILNNTAATYNPLLAPTQPVYDDFTNFQTLGLTAGANSAYDVSGFSGVDLLANASPALTLSNAASGETLAIQGAQANAVAWNPVVGATTLPITVGVDGAAPIAAGTVNTTVATTWAIDSLGNGTGANTLTLNDSTAVTGIVTAITVAGDETLTLTGTATGTDKIASINASADSANVDVSGVVAAAGGITITGGAGMLTANTDNMASPTNGRVDKVVSGTGGVTVTLGAGGAGGGAATGSETVDLSAATAASSITALTLPVAGDGTRGIVKGLHVTDNTATSDVLNFALGKTVVHNINTVTSQVSGNKYSVSNGIFTCLTAGALAATQLLDVQQLVSGDSTAGTGGANNIGAIAINGITYVIASDTLGAAGTIAAADQTAETIIQLNGVSGLSGFGNAVMDAVNTAAGNTLLVGGTLTLQNANNGGSALANATYNDAGYALDTLNNSAANITNTFNNLAPWAELQIAATVAAGNVVTTQTGASGTNSLVIDATGTFTLNSLSVSGDNALVFDATNGGETIKSLTDTTNTVATISITTGGNANAVDLKAISDTALTKIDATNTAAAVTLGDGAALSQNNLTILGGTGLLTATASGSHDTITILNGGSAIIANGAGDTIATGDGTNTITANGAGDSITIGSTNNGNAAFSPVQTIHASGAGDTITFSATGADGVNNTFTGASTVDGGVVGIVPQGIGVDSTVTFGNNAGAGAGQLVYLTGDLTGAIATGNYDYTTLNNVVHSAVIGTAYDQIDFNNVGVSTEHFAVNNLANYYNSTGAADSQVNVATATSLANALNIAAAEDASSQGPKAQIALNTGVIDWFQYAGNTYIVEANNATTAAAAHAALGTGDEVVKVTGLVDLSNMAFTGVNSHIIQF